MAALQARLLRDAERPLMQHLHAGLGRRVAANTHHMSQPRRCANISRRPRSAEGAPGVKAEGGRVGSAQGGELACVKAAKGLAPIALAPW